MNYTYLNFNNIDTSSVFNYGSYFSEDLQKLYKEELVDESLYFGSSNDDIIELSVYNKEGEIISFNYIEPSVIYNVYTGSYVNIDGETISYRYNKPQTNYCRYNSTILLNTQNILLQTNASAEGANGVLYNFIRNVAGNYNYNLYIREISSDRTEIRLGFAFDISSSVESNNYAVRTIEFAKRNIVLQDVFNQISDELNNNPIYQIFNDNADQLDYGKCCVLLGLKDTAQLQKYISLVYNGNSKIEAQSYNDNSSLNVVVESGIKDQIINFIYSNNLKGFSVDTLLDSLNVIVRAVSQKEILRKTTLNDSDLEEVLDIFSTVIYEDYLRIRIEDILNEYYLRYFDYYKNALNFGNGQLYKIFKHTSYTDEEGNINIQLKLDSPLPTRYDIKSFCWVSNISIAPVYFNVNLFTEPVSRKVKLTGVNYDVKVDSVETTNDELYESDFSYEDPNDIIFKLKENLNNLNINYNDFNNFIVYSSAELRTKLARNKVLQYSDYKTQENNISSIASTSNTEISSSYIASYNNIIKQECDLLNTFDNYDSYILFYVDVRDYQFEERINEAIEYDKANRDSLVNQLPDYIKNDGESSDYIKFTAMVGHFFDTLYEYVKKFPKLSSVLSELYPKEYIDEFLNTYNWTTFNNKFQNSYLYPFLFSNNSEDNLDDSSNISYYQYGKELLKRFAVNLPYIYKTAGTTKSLELIRAIYGISSELIQIKEYGSADYPITGKNYYDFDSITYLTKFQSGKEYIKFDYNNQDYEFVLKKSDIVKEPLVYTSSYYDEHNELKEYTVLYDSYLQQDYYREYNGIRTFEFSFRFDTKNIYDYNNIIPLIKKCDDLGNLNWEVKVFKTQKSVYGKLLFNFYDKSGIVYSCESEELPYFNGSIYTVFIKRGKKYASVHPDLNFDYISRKEVYYNTSSVYHTSLNEYALDEIDFVVNQYDGYVNNFNSTGSIVIDNNNSTEIFNFSSGSFYIGNYLSTNETSFYGNLDKIKVYLCELDDEDIVEHSYNIESISTPNKDSLYSDLKYLWSFDTPINLHSFVDNYPLSVNNCNTYYNNTFEVYNFERQSKEGVCGTEYFDKFPYQFDRVYLSQAINASSYGPNYKNNVKINKIDEKFRPNTVFTPYNYTAVTNTILGEDSNVIGFYINPSLYLENTIENFLGKEGIADIISDPINLKVSNYPKLKERLASFTTLNKKYIYSEEYYTLYKLFIDFSVFKYIDRVIPARTSLKKGLIVEANQLVREKVNVKDIYNDSSSLNLSFYNYKDKLTGSFLDLNKPYNCSIIDQLDYKLDIKIPTTYKTDYDQNNYNMIEIPDKVDDFDYITPLNYAFYNINKTYYITRNQKETAYYTINNSKPVKLSKTYYIYDLIENPYVNGSELSFYTNTKYKGGYSYRHKSKFTRTGTRDTYKAYDELNHSYRYVKGRNTKDSTINRNGLLNGSEPIIRIPGFLSLSQSVENLNVSVETSTSESGNLMVVTALTASMENSASLEQLIYNL